MKKLLILLWLAPALAAFPATLSSNVISILTRPNDWSGTNNFETGKLLVNGVPVGSSSAGTSGQTNWPASAITNAPWALSSGLADAQTNAMLNSFRHVLWTSNSISISAGATNIMGWITNLAGVDYAASVGKPQLLFSFDGTTWSAGSQNIVTNTRVKIAFFSGTSLVAGGGGDPGNPIPIPVAGGLDFVSVWVMTRPDLFGKTNALVGERLFLTSPTVPEEAATKGYVDQIFGGTAWWSARSDVEMNGKSLHASPTWETRLGIANNSDDLAAAWLGQQIWTLSSPLSQFGSLANSNLIIYHWSTPVVASGNNQVGTDWGTNITIILNPATITNSPMLLYSHTLQPPHWTRLPAVSSWPATNLFIQTTTNWNYDPGAGPVYPNPAAIQGYTYLTNSGIILSFAEPDVDMGFLKLAYAQVMPSFAVLNGVLELTPIPTIRSNSTTWGRTNLISTDGTNLLHAYGSNAWERIMTQRTW